MLYPFINLCILHYYIDRYNMLQKVNYTKFSFSYTILPHTLYARIKGSICDIKLFYAARFEYIIIICIVY